MVEGRLDLFLRDALSGRIVEHKPLGKNVVLNQMKAKLGELIAGSGTTYYIDQMQFGTGGTDPQSTDTGLAAPITPTKTVFTANPHEFSDDPSDSPAYMVSSDHQVMFIAFLLANEANGFPISEAGLMANDLTLYTRKTFSPISKSADYIFEFRWTLTVYS